jgi:putative molybdopterin biosynthesis protein
MSIYLNDIPLQEAQDHFYKALTEANLWSVLEVETVPLDEHANGRVMAEAVWAIISSPHYHASAMDGFALRATDTEGASLSAPIQLQFGHGTEYVDTGDPLPSWANAVIPIEQVEPLDEHGQPALDPRNPAFIRIRAGVVPWGHVRSMGEDMVATQLLLPEGHILRPVDLGAIAASGHETVKVARPPRVAVLPTGSELVAIGAPLEIGKIIEFNSLILASQVNAWGGVAHRFPIIPDEFDAILAQVRQAAQDFDLILLNAGSSAGSEDFSAPVVEALGDLLVHGVAIRPGHPVILGIIRGPLRDVPIIGVPGYPVSTALTGEVFVEPLIARWLGRKPFEPFSLPGELTRKVVSPAGDDDYMRVVVGEVGGRRLVAPLKRGAGVITSLVQADGIVVIPRGSQGMPAGADVNVRLYRHPEEITRTIFAIGSHDLALDILARFLARYDRRLASANVGSLGGLVALRRGEAHLAGSHLLDPESGEYNLPYIKQYLPGIPVNVLALVTRQQGLLVKPGNPKQISSLKDLVRKDVSFVNRQHGAGTRVLLDFQLDLMGIASNTIHGYNHEEFTHLSVAAAVASGRADCGMGIAAAAHALSLDFVPLFEERFDLIIPVEHAGGDLLTPLYKVLQDPNFPRAVNELPGYDTTQLGNLIAEIE